MPIKLVSFKLSNLVLLCFLLGGEPSLSDLIVYFYVFGILLIKDCLEYASAFNALKFVPSMYSSVVGDMTVS